jgi:hypothetical protein
VCNRTRKMREVLGEERILKETLNFGQQGSGTRVHMVRVVYVEHTALLCVCCSCFAACDYLTKKQEVH